MKKLVFIGWLLLILGLGLGGRGLAALGAAALLFAWLIYETKQRQGFRFLAQHHGAERLLSVGPRLHLAIASQFEEQVLCVEHSSEGSGPAQGAPLLSLHGWDGRPLWRRTFEQAPQAVLAGPQGRLYYATDNALVLCNEAGQDLAHLSFEPPLFRQSYTLLLSQDGGSLALHTPWFIQFASPDLSGLGPRIRYEETGHYLKYAALSPDGRGLLLAGALLLEESEETTAGMEARWDYWTRAEDGAWTQAWAKSYESANNSHLRGVSIQGGVLMAELYQTGYELRLYRADGSAIWERQGGERGVLSPGGEFLLWQSRYQGIQLSRVADQQQLWAHKPEEQCRLRAVDAQGRTLLLEGRRLVVLDPAGKPLWEDFFLNDPAQLSLGPGGRLCVSLDDKAAFIQVPFDR